jgi:hypothetical protein
MVEITVEKRAVSAMWGGRCGGKMLFGDIPLGDI